MQLFKKYSFDKKKFNKSLKKPFYGGKLHHITAEAKNMKTGDVICKVQGEWNNIMEFTYANVSCFTCVFSI